MSERWKSVVRLLTGPLLVCVALWADSGTSTQRVFMAALGGFILARELDAPVGTGGDNDDR